MTFVDFWRNQHAKLPISQPPSQIGDSTYVVTGANTGLGFECVNHLISMGAGRVILAVRSRQKGETALTAVQQNTGRKGVAEVWELDLASFSSVEAFAKRINTLDRLDGFISNAGVVMTSFQLSEKLELDLLVNFVSTMLLTLRVFPKLQESARKYGTQSRLVVVGSGAAFDAKLQANLAKTSGDILDPLSREKNFSAVSQYHVSKLLTIYAVRELASIRPVDSSGVIINLANPGLCYSDLGRNANIIGQGALSLMRKVLARTSEEGSRNLLHAAFAGSDSHGGWCSECQVKNEMIPSWMTDEAGKQTSKRVWSALLKMLESFGHGVDMKVI